MLRFQILLVLAVAAVSCQGHSVSRFAGNATSRIIYIPLYPVTPSTGTTPTGPTPAARAACPSGDSTNFHNSCLYEINAIRLAHNAPEVTYDDSLVPTAKACANAYARANSLTTPACNSNGAGITVGRNAATPAQACRAAIGDPFGGWYSEYVSGGLTFPAVWTAAAQNLIQVLWVATKRVGCAISDTKARIAGSTIDEFIIVCLWMDPGGTPSLVPTNVLEDTC